VWVVLMVLSVCVLVVLPRMMLLMVQVMCVW